MWKYFIILLLAIILPPVLKALVIRLTWDIPWPWYYLKKGLKLISTHSFACPNCGKHFKKAWYLYSINPLYHRAFAVLAFKKTNFKCPHCKVFDTCVIVENEGE